MAGGGELTTVGCWKLETWNLESGTRPARGVPHSLQNLAPGRFSVPHDEQWSTRPAPHSSQNFAPSRFQQPQLGQSMTPASSSIFRLRKGLWTYFPVSEEDTMGGLYDRARRGSHRAPRSLLPPALPAPPAPDPMPVSSPTRA